jgi:hypothetical protein
MQRLVIPALLLMIVAIAPAATAQQDFEVVASGIWAPAACAILPAMYPALQWFNPDHLEREFGGGPQIEQIASGDRRRVLGIRSGNRVQVMVLSPSGTQTPFFDGLPGASPRAIAVASSGRVFVTYLQAGSPFVAVISPAGVLEATHPLPAGLVSDVLAIAGDGCTLFYRSATAIARFDACTGTALPDFAPIPADLHDVEVLPDGRVLVTTAASVLLYTAAGVVERTVASLVTYGIDGEFGDATLSVDGGSVYIAVVNYCDAAGVLLQVSFATGAEVSRRPLGFGIATGLVAGVGLATVPTASELALLTLAVTLALAGIFVTKS